MHEFTKCDNCVDVWFMMSMCERRWMDVGMDVWE